MLLQVKNLFLKNAIAGSTDSNGANVIAGHCRIHRRGCSRAILLLRPLYLRMQVMGVFSLRYAEKSATLSMGL
jgi:hypothetical protein